MRKNVTIGTSRSSTYQTVSQIERKEMTCEVLFTFSMSRNKECARGSLVASMIPSKASVWWRRASIASIYPLGGPRFRDGPRKVQAVTFNEHRVLYK